MFGGRRKSRETQFALGFARMDNVADWTCTDLARAMSRYLQAHGSVIGPPAGPNCCRKIDPPGGWITNWELRNVSASNRVAVAIFVGIEGTKPK